MDANVAGGGGGGGGGRASLRERRRRRRKQRERAGVDVRLGRPRLLLLLLLLRKQESRQKLFGASSASSSRMEGRPEREGRCCGRHPIADDGTIIMTPANRIGGVIIGLIGDGGGGAARRRSGIIVTTARGARTGTGGERAFHCYFVLLLLSEWKVKVGILLALQNVSAK